MKHLKSVICFGLALVLALPQYTEKVVGNSEPVLSSGKINAKFEDDADDTEGTIASYISDLKLSTGRSKSEAERKLKSAGYTIDPLDLNKGGDGYVALGYKTSEKKEDAVTSIKVATMTHGYKEWDYRDFLRENAEGLPSTISGMIASINKLKTLYDSGSFTAQIAYKNLNVLCVPASSSETTGQALGDYLFENKDNYENLETIFLVLQSETLTYINNQLAFGCSGTYVNSNKEDKTTWIKNPTFLKDILTKIEDKFTSYQSELETEELILNLISKYNFLIDDVLDEDFVSSLDEKATLALKDANTYIFYDGTAYRSLFDILTSDSKFLKALFFDALPSNIDPTKFVEFINVYANDADKKVPGTIPALPEIVSPWLKNAVSYLNNLQYNPFDEEGRSSILEDYKGSEIELEFFNKMAHEFLDEYREKVDDCREILEDYGEDLSLAEIIQLVTEKVEKQNKDAEEDERASDALFYLTPYEILTKYKFVEKEFLTIEDELDSVVKVSSLADYIELIDEYYDYDDDIANALAVAFVNGTDEADRYCMKTSGFPIFVFDSSVNPQETEKLEKQYIENKKVINDAYYSLGFEENENSIWFGTNKDLLEDKSVAQTNRTIRQSIIDDEFKNRLLEAQVDNAYKLRISDAMTYGGIACAVVGVVMSVIFLCLVKTGTVVGGMGTLLSAGLFSTMGMGSTFGLGVGGSIAAACGLVAFVGMLILMVVLIILMIIFFCTDDEEPEEEDPERTPIPQVMIDCDLDINNTVTKSIRYDVITNLNGEAVDINNEESAYWNALYFTRSNEVGSPLVVPEGGSAFVLTEDDSTGPEFSVSVKDFGSTGAYSLNTNGDCDDPIYLHYFTYNSLRNITDGELVQGKYVADIIMAVAETRALAKAAIGRKGAEYTLIDIDLTPDSDYYTYIAYSTTDNKKSAIKDIRASYGTDVFNFSWGDPSNSYVCVYDSSETSCPIKTPGDDEIAQGTNTDFFWNLYVSYSDNVGDPILASSLGIKTSLDDINDGYEYARWFSGAAFDFATVSDDSDYFPNHKFLQYAPEEQYRHYKNETKYLAGFSFFSSSTKWLGNGSKSLDTYAKELGCVKFGTDITAGGMNDEYDKTFIFYSTTTNPKKAISDIGIFTSQPTNDSDGMLVDNICRNGTYFNAALVIQAGDKGYNSKGGDTKVRTTRNSHAYVTSVTTEAEMGYGNFEGYKVKARGLYVAGPSSSTKPIKLDDVVYSYSKSNIPTANGKNDSIMLLSNGQKANSGLGTNWKSVHALDQYFYDVYDANDDLANAGHNIGLSRDDESLDCLLYIYFKNGNSNIVREKYLSSIELVGTSSDDEDDAPLFNNIRYTAMGAGQEILGLSEPLFANSTMVYDATNNTIAYKENTNINYTRTFAYVVVSYQKSSSKAVGSIKIGSSDGAKGLSLPVDYTEHLEVHTRGNYSGNNYSFYTSSAGDPIGRISLLGKESTPVNNVVASMTYLETIDGEIFATNLSQYIAFYDATTPTYIGDIKIVKGGSLQGQQLAMSQKGYKQFIVSDLLGGNTSDVYHIAIARTSTAAKAIKDIRIVNKDYGEEAVFFDRLYKRVNDKSLVDTRLGFKEEVWVYTTLGNTRETNGDSSVKTYAERVAITEIGINYLLGRYGDNSVTYWNGSTVENVDTVKPASITDDKKILYAMNYDNSSKARLSGDTYDYQRLNLGPGVSQNFEDTHGNSYIVYTTNSNCSMLDYEAGYLSNYYTGSKSGDKKKGLATVVSSNSILVSCLVLGGGAIAALVAIFFVMKKKEKEEESK